MTARRLPLADVLAVAYVLQLEDLSRDFHARTIAAAIGQTTMPSWVEVQADFDAALAGPVGERTTVRDDTGRGVKLRVLGV